MGKLANESDADPFTIASAQARIDNVEAKIDEALRSGIEAGDDLGAGKLFGIELDEAKMEQLMEAITVAVVGLKDAKKIKSRLQKDG